jgi:hypothetical protein
MARAASIDLATGLDASNNLITTGGTADAHWTVQELAGGTGAAQVVVPSSPDWYGLWLNNGPNSDWIARNQDFIQGPPGYTFTRTFDLTGLSLSTVSITGSWGIDDGGTLSLNGHLIASLPGFDTGHFEKLTPFSVAEGSPFLVQGLNTLTITMTDANQDRDAVRLEGTVSGTAAAVPEPASLVLGGTSLLIGLGCWWRRRKSGRPHSAATSPLS